MSSDFDWNVCKARFTTQEEEKIAFERGVRPFIIDRLRERNLLGLCYCTKWHAWCIAFPISDPDGNTWRAHCRSPKRNGDGKWDWAYEPSEDPLKRPIPALVLGQLTTAHTAHVFESQWDAIAVIDKLDLLPEIDDGKICIIATRGAQIGSRLSALSWAPNINICVWPQNDEAAKDWLPDTLRQVGGAYIVQTLQDFKDVGEWVKDGNASPADLEAAIQYANFQRAPPPKAQASQQGAEPRIPRALRGASIIDFAERAIDHSKNLLGNRWLSCLQGAFFVAPSGHGKSTWVIQATACWACGLTAFGIHPARPLRILILQSEDDDNDVTEMSWLTDRLGLTSTQRDLVRKNTHLEWLNDAVGAEFFLVADDFLSAFKPDVLFINPYSAYQGGDIRDDKLNNEFLRIRLSALLTKHNCGAIPVHHTPKTQFQKLEDFSWFDWMYSMAGGAALTNWARGVLIMVPSVTPGTYKFIAAKRFEKIGWQEREYWFSHSLENGRFLWVPATQTQIAAAQSGGRQATPDAILALIPVLDPIMQQELWVLAKEKLKVGVNAARDLVKILLHQQKIFEHDMPRQNASKFAKAAIGYSRTKP
jgi:hypothetical protein